MEEQEKKFKAKKALGQNFLIDSLVAPKMVALSGIDKKFGVLEIGPGRGALTEELLKISGRVVAVEIDTTLIPGLKARFGSNSNFTLICGDFLKLDLPGIISNDFEPGMPVAVFGNLPYYITSPLIMKLLEEKLPIEMAVVMVQKEAALRLAAREASRESGAVTLAVRYFSSPEILFDVTPESFYPVPKVASCVLKLLIREKPPVVMRDEAFMFKIIKAAYSQRRKTAVNAISAGMNIKKESVAAAFSFAGLDVMTRAERLTLADYASLSDRLLEQ